MGIHISCVYVKAKLPIYSQLFKQCKQYKNRKQFQKCEQCKQVRGESYVSSVNSENYENRVTRVKRVSSVNSRAHNLCHDNRQLIVLAINVNHSASKNKCN